MGILWDSHEIPMKHAATYLKDPNMCVVRRPSLSNYPHHRHNKPTTNAAGCTARFCMFPPGGIPEEIGQLTRLTRLSLGSCKLVGESASRHDASKETSGKYLPGAAQQ